MPGSSRTEPTLHGSLDCLLKAVGALGGMALGSGVGGDSICRKTLGCRVESRLEGGSREARARGGGWDEMMVAWSQEEAAGEEGWRCSGRSAAGI